MCDFHNLTMILLEGLLGHCNCIEFFLISRYPHITIASLDPIFSPPPAPGYVEIFEQTEK